MTTSEENTQEKPDARSFEERVFARFDALDTRFSSLEEKVAGFDTRLSGLEEKVEKRAVETKPIWERALSEIAELRNETHAGFRNVERQVGVLSKDIVQLRADVAEVTERLNNVEFKP
jgi:chromosome segregation ATPase